MFEQVLSVAVSFLGVLMSVAHFPQAYLIIKQKSAKDVSLLTYSIFTLGSIVWLIYGIVLVQIPIILTFSVAVVGTVSVMLLAVKYR